MSFRILISLLLSLTLGCLLFAMNRNFVAGMNPYLNGIFSLIPITFFIVNYIVTSKVKLKTARILLRIIMLLGIIIPVVLLFLIKPKIQNTNTPRRYFDSSGIHN